MNFKKYQPRYTNNSVAIRINKGNLNISALAYKALGQPKNVNLFYDREAKAIKLVENQQGLKVTTNKDSFSSHISGAIWKIMPLGIYIYNEKEQCFIYED